MKNFRLGSKITQEIERIAKEVVNTDCQSFDHNRALFQKRLKDYYRKEMHSSDNLIMRKREIDYYGKTILEILQSALVGAILGLCVGLGGDLGALITDNTPNKGAQFGTIVSLIVFLTVILFLFIRYFSKMTNYQKLHCEEFERELIDKQLEDRLSIVEKEWDS